jgi:hypothetical protein
MINEEDFQRLAGLAYKWAKAQEAYVIQHGVPLTETQLADARQAGVSAPHEVRVLVVNRIQMPEDKELADASRSAQIITEASRGVAIGYAIIIRADSWQNRELLLHQLVHVAQCERSGGLGTFVHEYLSDRHRSPNFSVGNFEDEARSRARDICAAESVGQPGLTH